MGEEGTRAGHIRQAARSGVAASECMKVLDRLPDETSADYVYRLLYYNILMLYMPPGSWIREGAIADQLGLSRTPVHAAMGFLRDRHLVDVAPQSATHVSKIDISELRQGCFMRAAIEPLVFKQVGASLTDDDRLHLTGLVERQREIATGGRSEDEYVELDAEFHRTVYVAAGKGFVWEFVRKACAPYDRVRSMGVLFGYERPAIEEHEELLHYLTFGGLTDEGLDSLVRAHLSHYVTYFDKLQADFPDYFTFGE